MNNRNTTLIIIILVLLIGLSLFMLSRDNVSNEVYHKKYVPVNELGDFNNYLLDYFDEYNSIIVKSYLDNNTLDNIDLLTTKNKVLFTFNNILKDKNNYNKFLVLDNKSLEKVEKDPTDNNVLAYMYKNDFIGYYNQLFNEELKINEIDKSNTNNDFDNYNLYVYYKNNNTKYKIDGIYSTKNTIDDNYVITADVTILLNKDLSKKLNKDKVEALVQYTYLENDVIDLISFKTKTSN